VADTHRIPRATQLVAPLFALVALSYVLPAKNDAAVVLSGLAASMAMTCVSWVAIVRGQPPSRVVRRALSVAVGVFVLASLAVTPTAVRSPFVEKLPFVFAPAVVVAGLAAWRRQGWDGWGHLLLACALALLAAPYTVALLAVAAARMHAGVGPGPLLYTDAVLLLGAVVGWGVAPFARTVWRPAWPAVGRWMVSNLTASDAASRVGLVCLGLAAASQTMFAFALSQDIHCPECDRIRLGSQYPLWAAYFTVHHSLLMMAGVGGFTSLFFAKKRVLSMAAFVLAMAQVLTTPM
jgi:hypothetical protein